MKNRRYIVFSRQFYSQLLQQHYDMIDEVMVGPYEDGCEFEFSFKFMKFRESDKTHCQLNIYDDAFAAFDEYRDLFDKLKKIQSLTLEELEGILVECGFEEMIDGRLVESDLLQRS